MQISPATVGLPLPLKETGANADASANVGVNLGAPSANVSANISANASAIAESARRATSGGDASARLSNNTVNASGDASQATPAAGDSGTPVSLSAAAQASAEKNVPAAVYAEIWQGSVKIAQVDIHGHVSSYSPLVASGGGGLAGPLVAAQRAVQLARLTGGEIRAAGQALDSQTLLMRAKLANTYAV